MRIQNTDNTPIDVKLVLDEANDILSLKERVKEDIVLEIKFPFNVNKIKPAYRDISIRMEDVLVFRNNYFSQFDICEVKIGSGESKKRIGLLFKPFIIFESDATFLFQNDLVLKTTIFRSISILLNNQATLPAAEAKITGSRGLLLNDLYPEDIILGVFPNEWNDGISVNLPEILLNLYLYGFYGLTKEKDRAFMPPSNSFQKDKLSTIRLQGSSFRQNLDIAKVSPVVKDNEYLIYYLDNLLKQSNENGIAKFYQLYGIIEIFKDEVLKKEILEKINSTSHPFSLLTGYKAQKLILEISKDIHSIERFFQKYGSNPATLTDSIFWEILSFINGTREKNEIDLIKDMPQSFYYLRNLVVHDIQFLYKNSFKNPEDIRNDFDKLFYGMEYLVMNTLQTSRL